MSKKSKWNNYLWYFAIGCGSLGLTDQSGLTKKLYCDYFTSNCTVPFFEDIKRKKIILTNESELRKEFE
jgi:hypothetical protein